MRKLIGQPVGQFALRVIILSILFPTLLLAWGRKPPEPEPVKLVTAPLCFKSVQPSNSLSDADIVELARRYQKISDAQTGFTAEQMARLREIRPEIQITRYLNLSAVHSPLQIEAALRHHPDWVMRDKHGNPLPSLWGTGGLLMRPNSEGWRDHLFQKASQYIITMGYDGIMGDVVLMCGKLGEDFIGINTETNRPYTTEEYRNHQLWLIRAVKAAIRAIYGEHGLVLNSVLRGFFYFKEKPYSFLDAADGVVAEGFRGSTHWPLERHLSETAWLANIEMMRDVQSRGKAIVVVVKVTKKVADQYTSQQLEDWERFWYCTFLLGLKDSAYYTASITDPTTRGGKMALFNPHHETDLGEPLGEFYKTAKGYGRKFERAWVYVDLTKHEGIIIRKQPRIQDEESTD